MGGGASLASLGGTPVRQSNREAWPASSQLVWVVIRMQQQPPQLNGPECTQIMTTLWFLVSLHETGQTSPRPAGTSRNIHHQHCWPGQTRLLAGQNHNWRNCQQISAAENCNNCYNCTQLVVTATLQLDTDCGIGVTWPWCHGALWSRVLVVTWPWGQGAIGSEALGLGSHYGPWVVGPLGHVLGSWSLGVTGPWNDGSLGSRALGSWAVWVMGL